MTQFVTEMDAYTEERRLIALATSRILDEMDVAQLTQAELARRIGVTDAHVSQVLSGSRNMTLRTLATFALGCGFTWDISAWRAATCVTYTRTPEPVAAGHEVQYARGSAAGALPTELTREAA